MGDRFIEYEQEIHRNLFKLVSERRFNWFRIDDTRNDRSWLIQAIKTFIDNWGCAEFNDDTYSKFRVFLRPDKVYEEMEKRGLVKKQVVQKNYYGDFYTKAMLPESIMKQAEIFRKASSDSRSIPSFLTDDSLRVINKINENEKRKLRSDRRKVRNR